MTRSPAVFVESIGAGTIDLIKAGTVAISSIPNIGGTVGISGGSVLLTNSTATPLPAMDYGAAWTHTWTYIGTSDMTGTADLTAAPSSGLKVVADDMLISTDTAMSFTVQMETTANVLAKLYLGANSVTQITLRDGLKADAIDKKIQGLAGTAGNVAVTTCWHSEA